MYKNQITNEEVEYFSIHLSEYDRDWYICFWYVYKFPNVSLDWRKWKLIQNMRLQNQFTDEKHKHSKKKITNKSCLPYLFFIITENSDTHEKHLVHAECF